MESNIKSAIKYADDLKEGVRILIDKHNGIHPRFSLSGFRQLVNSHTKNVSNQLEPIRDYVQNTSAQSTSKKVINRIEGLFNELPDSYTLERDFSYNSAGSERPFNQKEKDQYETKLHQLETWTNILGNFLERQSGN